MKAISEIGNVVQNIEELSRILDGTIIDPVSGARLPPTAESRTAADNAVTLTMGAVLDALVFPLSLGTMGSLDRVKVNSIVGKVVSAMRSYVIATTKP